MNYGIMSCIKNVTHLRFNQIVIWYLVYFFRFCSAWKYITEGIKYCFLQIGGDCPLYCYGSHSLWKRYSGVYIHI